MILDLDVLVSEAVRSEPFTWRTVDGFVRYSAGDFLCPHRELPAEHAS